MPVQFISARTFVLYVNLDDLRSDRQQPKLITLLSRKNEAAKKKKIKHDRVPARNPESGFWGGDIKSESPLARRRNV